MLTYRFYRLDRNEHICGQEEIHFENDTDALTCAMEMAGTAAIELWQGGRKIAYIAPALWPMRADIQAMRKSGELPPRKD